MKKLLVMFAAAGALAVPAGAALAQEDPAEPEQTTTVDTVRQRARDRTHQGEAAGECEGTGDMSQTRERQHAHESAGDGQRAGGGQFRAGQGQRGNRVSD